VRRCRKHPPLVEQNTIAILANVVWPSLFLTQRLSAWWIIGAGLVIEWAFVRRLTQTSILRSAIMTVVMNIVSTTVGILGIPLSGLLWELIASITIQPIFNWGTFNPVTWLISCVLAASLNTVLEVATLRLLFKISWTKKLFWWLAVANFITVGMAIISIMIIPPKT